MPLLATIPLIATLTIFSVGLADNSAAAKVSKDYEQCWKVVEALCEGNGSKGCTQLVRLCGHLLRDHISEAHRPNGEKCPHYLAHNDLIIKRQRTIEELDNESGGNETKSVKLSQKLASVTAANPPRTLFRKPLSPRNTITTPKETTTSATPTSNAYPPTTAAPPTIQVSDPTSTQTTSSLIATETQNSTINEPNNQTSTEQPNTPMETPKSTKAPKGLASVSTSEESLNTTMIDPSSTVTPNTTMSPIPRRDPTLSDVSTTEDPNRVTRSPAGKKGGILTDGSSSVSVAASDGKEEEPTRRSELRGMLPSDQALTYPNPLEKRTSYKPSPRPREPYMKSVLDYRMSIIENNGRTVVNWLANNEAAFREFLVYWKNDQVQNYQSGRMRQRIYE